MNQELTHAFFMFILLGIIIYAFFLNFEIDINTQRIANLTNEWIENVTIRNNPNKVANMFCSDAKLVATVSKIIRRGLDIEQYFNFFVNLPNIEDLVVDREERGKNIAQQLINKCIEYAKSQNCYKIILNCNENLIKFYEKNNFYNVGYQMRMNI